MRLLLIRHGQTPANVLGQLNTAVPGPRLTDLGRQQAALIPDALRGSPIESISASILVRAQLTAEPLARERGLPVAIRSGLHEIAAGDLEDRTDRDSVRLYLETVCAWAAGDLSRRMPGATDGHAFFERYDADVADVADLAGTGANTSVIFSHGAAIRVWVAGRATNVPPDFAAKNELGNTGVVELIGSPSEGWVLASWAGAAPSGANHDENEAGDPRGESLRETSG